MFFDKPGRGLTGVLLAAVCATLVVFKPTFAPPVQQALRAHHRTADNTVYFPLTSRAGSCTALLDATTAELLDAF